MLTLGQDLAQTRTGEHGYGKPATVGEDDTLQDALKTMTYHNVRGCR